MSEEQRRQARVRFTDFVTFTDDDVDVGFEIDRESPQYKAGRAAAIAGRDRDQRKSLDWLAGFDEA